MKENKYKNIIEALLFVSGKPVEYKVLKNVLEISMKEIRDAIEDLNKEYEGRGSGLLVTEIAEGFQLITKPEYSFWLKKMYGNKKLLRLPPTSLETLAIIAYKQPVTKAEIENIRGVNSDGVVKNLLEKKMVCITGRKEVIGRPLLYGTTKDFLEYFGLRTLSDLPDIEELEAIFEEKQQEENNEMENIKDGVTDAFNG
jgi:segregation and condensation protein B